MTENKDEFDFQIYEASKDELAEIHAAGNWDPKLKKFLERFFESIDGEPDDIVFSVNEKTGELRCYLEESLFAKLQELCRKEMNHENESDALLPF